MRPALFTALLLLAAAAATAAGPGRGLYAKTGTEGKTLYAQARRSYDTARYLGNEYTDRNSGFSIKPPGQWFLDNRTRKFAVRFSSRNYHAFIMIDLVVAPTPVELNREFADFIHQKNNEIKAAIPSFEVISNRYITVNHDKAYKTEAAFTAGVNRVFMNVYYIPYGNRIYLISTACPEAELRGWEPILEASVQTFRVLD